MLVTGPCCTKHFVCLFSFTHYNIPLREAVLSAPFSSRGSWSSGRSHNLFRVKELIKERAGFQWWIDNNISLVILYQELSISLQSGHLHFWKKKRQKVLKCLRKITFFRVEDTDVQVKPKKQFSRKYLQGWNKEEKLKPSQILVFFIVLPRTILIGWDGIA